MIATLAFYIKGQNFSGQLYSFLEITLTKFIDKGELNELEEKGLIQAFEYTHELAWNVLRDYLLAKGHQAIYASRDDTRAAFTLNLIQDREIELKRRTKNSDVEEPAIETTIVEKTHVEEPAVENPVVEETPVEEPAVETPVVEETTVEEPAVETKK